MWFLYFPIQLPIGFALHNFDIHLLCCCPHWFPLESHQRKKIEAANLGSILSLLMTHQPQKISEKNQDWSKNVILSLHQRKQHFFFCNVLYVCSVVSLENLCLFSMFCPCVNKLFSPMLETCCFLIIGLVIAYKYGKQLNGRL